MTTKEYIVTLKTKDDLNQFYIDMELKGYSCAVKRPLSRNTHYYLTEEQAKEIEKDERVLACEEPFDKRNVICEPCGWVRKYRFGEYLRLQKTGNYPDSENPTPNTYYQRTDTYNNLDDHPWINSEGQQSPFANNGLLNFTGPHPQSINTYSFSMPKASTLDHHTPSLVDGYEADIKCTVSGRNVDIVIVDTPVDPNHVEFSVNADGTGGSRVKQINWFGFTEGINNDETNFPGANYSTPENYPYPNLYSNEASFHHGTFCAGVAAGNINGIARDSNIYSLDPFPDSPHVTSGAIPSTWASIWPDYIRYFHLNKAINPETGRKNPTICNMSFTYLDDFSYHESWHLASTMEYQGSTVTLPTSTIDYSSKNSVHVPTGIADRVAFLTDRNISTMNVSHELSSDPYINVPRYQFPSRIASLDADLEDMINDGIIIVGAAGNSFTQVAKSTDADYNNNVTFNSNTYYFHRGGSPAAASNVICVGANNENLFQKSIFSNYGSRIDIWAHGENVIGPSSSETFNQSSFGFVKFTHFNVPDGRDSGYYQCRGNGTSFASPNIVGVLAGVLEIEPTTNQEEARNYLEEFKIRSSNYSGADATTGLTGWNPSKNLNDYKSKIGSSHEYSISATTSHFHQHIPYQLVVPRKREFVPSNMSVSNVRTFVEGLTIYPHDTYKSRTPTTTVNGMRYPRINTRITKST
jgi:hypothetical protein